MTSAAPPRDAVRVYWRPGCPYCTMLRLGLRSARVPARWVNIWEDAAAAAAVRDITGGDETVPTVVVGDTAMVNPSARQVIDAARAARPRLPPAVRARPALRLARAARLLTRRLARPLQAVDRPPGPHAC